MILITGASGFVGRHLVCAVSGKGIPVRAVYHRNRPHAALLQLPGVEWVQADLLDVFELEEVLRGVTEIYHCAAVVSFDPEAREGMMRINVEGTARLVNEALLQKVRKLVFVSSVAALGRNANSSIITEEEQWEESRYNSAYGSSKYLAEMEVWRGISEGLPAVILNPGIILGAGDFTRGSAALIRLADREFPFFTEGVNAFVDVQDVVRAATGLMQSSVHSERFILSAGNFAYREIFTMMAGALGRKPPHIRASAWMSGLIWRWQALRRQLTGRTVSLTRETVRNAQKISLYDNSKLLRMLPGFSYTDMRKTIADMCTAYIKFKDS